MYPPREGGGRWRAVWLEDGERKQCESVSEEKLTAKLVKVRERLVMGVLNTSSPDKDLVDWYLNPARRLADHRWSRGHAATQDSLRKRFVRPVDKVTCQDITVNPMQKIMNAAPTAGEGDRVQRLLSAGRHRYLPGGRSCQLQHHARDVRRHTSGVLGRAREATE